MPKCLMATMFNNKIPYTKPSSIAKGSNQYPCARISIHVPDHHNLEAMGIKYEP